MIKAGMSPGLNALKRLIDTANKCLGEAEARAINDIAKEVAAAWTDDLECAFDRPTKTTLNSVKLWPAKLSQERQGHRVEATVFIRDKAPRGTSPAEYLQSQAKGGPRASKPFELQLLMEERRLPSGGFLHPAKSAPRDKHGNVPKRELTKALKSIRDHERTKSGSPSVQYVIAAPSGKRLGIWKRDNKKRTITPFFIFKTGQQDVKQRLALKDTAVKVLGDKAQKYLIFQIEKALKGGKK